MAEAARQTILQDRLNDWKIWAGSFRRFQRVHADGINHIRTFFPPFTRLWFY